MIETPIIKVLVHKSFLTAGVETEFVDAYLMGIDARPNHHIRFTVYLSSGAVWSGLPIEAVYCDRFNPINVTAVLETSKLQPFSCLEGPASVITYSLLKNAKLETSLGPANYLFTVNYQGEGLAEDPEQYKTHNIVVLTSGQLAALPNNQMRVLDNWFASSQANATANYKRSNKFYFPGG